MHGRVNQKGGQADARHGRCFPVGIRFSIGLVMTVLAGGALAQDREIRLPDEQASEPRTAAQENSGQENSGQENSGQENSGQENSGQGDVSGGRDAGAGLLSLFQAWIAADPRESADSQARSPWADVAWDYLRVGQLNEAMTVLGEAADRNPPPENRTVAGLAGVAAAWNRRLAALDADQRFASLREWSLPTETRRTVRVLASLVPQDAPPKAFARAIGERPRDHSFPVSEINGIDGLFSTAWLLVKSAEETGRLRGLIAELTALSEQGVPAADEVLSLARIVADDRRDEGLETTLRQRLAVLQRQQPPERNGKGPVPDNLIWQYGYTPVDPDPLRIDFQPLPFWTGSLWSGSAEYPDPKLGWTSLDLTGGHTGRQFSPVRRWVAPADGTLTIVGELRHHQDRGDGVQARIVGGRTGLAGQWHALNHSTSTIVQSIEVHAWETIDFVVDRVQTDTSDRYLWTVQLTLITTGDEVLTFDSIGSDPAPKTTNVLGHLTLAAACLGHDRLSSIGESMIEKLLENAGAGSSPLISPALQRARAVAVATRYSDAGPIEFGGSRPQNWVAANGEDAVLHAAGGSPALWLAHDEHLLQVSGTRSGALLFRYPLTGEFEFSCETQQGGGYPTDGGLIYAGLQFLAKGGKQDLTVHDPDASHFVKKPCPFVRGGPDAVFNRISIRSTAEGAMFLVGGHPVWRDSRVVDSSPWIGLRAFGDRRPLFRNLKLTGRPIIPREVRLVDETTMRGWQAKYFGESQASFAFATSFDPRPDSWSVSDGTISNAKREVDAEAPSQSLLRYQRPLLEGESISYEFYSQPGEIEVHPSLGRLAFFIEPDGVRLHWITDGARDWTGLDEDNAIVEPLNRRGPKTLPLKLNDWNRLVVSLTGDEATLSLNDEVIYQRHVEPENGRQFGFYHDRRRSEVRVRNVLMTGNWPEKIPDEVLTDLAAPASAERSDAQRRRCMTSSAIPISLQMDWPSANMPQPCQTNSGTPFFRIGCFRAVVAVRFDSRAHLRR